MIKVHIKIKFRTYTGKTYTGKFIFFPVIPLQDVLSFAREDTLLSHLLFASNAYLKFKFLFQQSNSKYNEPSCSFLKKND